MKILIEVINYHKLKWQICGDLKVIALLLGIQGFTKYCCCIGEWDSRAQSLHTQERIGLPENLWNQECGNVNVENQPLVEPSKILSTSMHLKLGLMKNSVKAMNQEEPAFTSYEKSSRD